MVVFEEFGIRDWCLEMFWFVCVLLQKNVVLET